MMHNYIGHKFYPRAITEFRLPLFKSKMADMSLKLLLTPSTSFRTSINGIKFKSLLLYEPKPYIDKVESMTFIGTVLCCMIRQMKKRE